MSILPINIMTTFYKNRDIKSMLRNYIWISIKFKTDA